MSLTCAAVSAPTPVSPLRTRETVATDTPDALATSVIDNLDGLGAAHFVDVPIDNHRMPLKVAAEGCFTPATRFWVDFRSELFHPLAAYAIMTRLT